MSTSRLIHTLRTVQYRALTPHRHIHTSALLRAPQQLQGTELQQQLAKLPSWQHTAQPRSTIHKQYKFNNFVECYSYMTAVALYAEKHGHHPEWSNVYNTLNITLTTHDCGGVSMNDIEMAQFCDKTAQNYKLQ